LVTAILAPSEANFKAIAFPIPLEAPVIRAVLPSSIFIMVNEFLFKYIKKAVNATNAI
jgi:hypothetical protein